MTEKVSEVETQMTNEEHDLGKDFPLDIQKSWFFFKSFENQSGKDK